MQHTLNKNVPGRKTKTPEPRRNGFLTPWVWIAPTLVIALVFLVYPVFNTILLSFQNRYSTQYVGFKNYATIFSDSTMLEVLRNNVLWLILATLLCVGLGLIIATLTDKVKFEGLAKAAIFTPMAISFVGASIIWRFVYAYAPANRSQIGLINALIVGLGGQPVSWLTTTTVDNLALIVIFVWIWTGFCMVILSASIKGIPADILEAARVDGAGSLTIFLRITIPMITPTITVVITTMVIYILKIFDVIYATTGGDYQTNVVAMAYYQQLFQNNNYGLGSALAVLLLIAVIPVMYINVRRFRAQEASR